MSGENCSWDLIRLAPDPCKFVKDNCFFSYFSLLEFNYCVINNNTWLTYILAIIILILCFYFLSTTGNDYLAPALGIISEKLNLSQNLAGLTLLALGNQAPDVIVAFVAGEDENEGVETSLGSLLGGGFLVVAIVLSTVVMYGREVTVVPANFLRDIGVYFIALCYVCLLGYLERIYLWQSFIFFLFYLIYVIICFIMDKKKTEEIENNIKDSILKESMGKSFKVKLFNNTKHEEDTIKEESDDDDENSINNSLLKDTSQDSDPKETSRPVYTQSQISGGLFDIEKIIKKSFFHKKVKSTIEQYKTDDVITGEMKLYSKFKYGIVRHYLNSKESTWKSMSLSQKILFVFVDFPMNILRDATIPPYEASKWKRSIFILQPITIPLFLIVMFNLYETVYNHWIISLIIFAILLVICFIFYRITYRTSLPNCEWLLLFSAFVLSILWLWCVTNILLDMIVTAKLLFPSNIPQSFLSMTILACGNSLPDFIVNCSLARTGYAEMALSGSIGAPAFGILMGFGLSLARRLFIQNYIKKKGSFEVFDLFNYNDNLNKKILTDALICIFTMLLVLIIMGFAMNFKIGRPVSYFGYAIYCFFFLSIIVLTFFN